ncbi:DegT/DnrJ/EryC1/StrS family aminotransferase [Niabella hibiscisoli]|uniref:DegT/DnrJ/EryC1/StrS family aminotransferase n=1 Tax=Niabella hibiscisoli TaxID=1825928 RepID=UPI001F0F53BF|nr:DegT/DnrJ/EryC1/StrS family aminotransferase [Niabella hibiscisoli]MCH5716820.1 DegT/DnrJ/EryC1/StrS family aminotransferase [Niabella hibiscisoli]
MRKLSSIQVTKSFLPPMEEYIKLLHPAWSSNQLTNGGSLLLQLMDALKAYLNVSQVLVTANGTLALQIAIKALALRGEIITTPFSYIATSAAIAWQGCVPVFVDIEEDHWCIDADKIEQAITPNTSAILATHVFGNPCNVEVIEEIALRHGLKVIYDGAHCFGVNYLGQSIFNYGDISVCSFHATKLFHTAEGGCLITPDEKLLEKIMWLHNLGHNGPVDFHGLGINGKASELHAAMGLAVLPHVKPLVESRKQRAAIYDGLLQPGLQKIQLRKGTDWNYGYYPVLFDTAAKMFEIKAALNEEQIFPAAIFIRRLIRLNICVDWKCPSQKMSPHGFYAYRCIMIWR